MSDLNLNRTLPYSQNVDLAAQTVEGACDCRPVEKSLVQSFRRVQSEDGHGMILVPMPRSDILQNVHLAADYTATHPEELGRLIVLCPGNVKELLLEFVVYSDLFSILCVCKDLFKDQIEKVLEKRGHLFLHRLQTALQSVGQEREIEDIKQTFSVSHFAKEHDFYKYLLESEKFFKALYDRSYDLAALYHESHKEALQITREGQLAYHQIAIQMYDMISSGSGVSANTILASLFHELDIIVKMIGQVDQENPEPILELSGTPLSQSRPCLEFRKDPETQTIQFLFEDSDAPFLPISFFDHPERIVDLFAPDGLRKIPPQIIDCVNLHSLTLMGCTYLEALPPEIGQLYNLTSLILPKAYGPYTKPRLQRIPDEITHLKNLKQIEFNHRHDDISFEDCYERHACKENTCTYFSQDFSPLQQKWLQELEEKDCEVVHLHVPPKDEDESSSGF